MTISEAFFHIRQAIATLYDTREAGNIADLVLEKATGLDRSGRIINSRRLLSPTELADIETAVEKLGNAVPVQYVLEEAWFSGMPFYVNPDVLIPRPETEELVDWIVKDPRSNGDTQLKIIDIGTGSGCIPISLKKLIPEAETEALDVSRKALQVASRNAEKLKADLRFIEMDFTDRNQWNTLGRYDIIVSNPPYIPLSERREMAQHVTDHEPHLALFVPDEDPFRFYRLLAEFAGSHLKEDGAVYMEIHESFGKEVPALFREKGFCKIELKKDMQGKDRMLRAAY